MRSFTPILASAIAFSILMTAAAQADGGKNNQDWAVRTPSGPTDSRLAGKETAPPQQSAPQPPGSPSKMDAAPAISPPAAPQSVEEATPTPAVKAAGETAPVAQTQSLGGAAPPLWENRWFWVLLALLLLGTAGAVEFLGRKRDERLAAEEPDDVVKA